MYGLAGMHEVLLNLEEDRKIKDADMYGWSECGFERGVFACKGG